ncbi:3-hydroxybutyryl-CoA dehydrogenase [Lentzea sp. NBRC 105346]|uniref:3-hydroxyacyl-CoA dehydrogenase family protein n=1 Tax=Lentzea sp. NBRC 105346 TaxID=3032205 RepID=UPI0024A0A0D2|nr:3-hydroxyacyl-CoA dehydrogenase family protein [Lentzea sp. NBRC 105346]GLZ27943.1 3-hydroxybutyryl-CoA dehydrogenase [Lentzea sp. NBRC 105346]
MSHNAEVRLAVLGAGVMGLAIATMAVGCGVPVILVETDATKRDEAGGAVTRQLRMAHLLGGLDRTTVPGRLEVTGAVDDVAGATAVVEAIVEDAGAKAEVLRAASAVVAPGTVLATNTSGIPVDELADAVARPEELVGTHFMNPPYLIATVEVVRGRRTGDAALERTRAVLAALGRQAIVVGDGPGFVSSRILHRMINDAIRIVDEGRAPVEAVDALMQGCGHKVGPLRTADLIGLDNLADSLRCLYERTGDETFRPAELLLRKVRDGHRGRKSGRGFYEYVEAF